jgi:hypothetical protein
MGAGNTSFTAALAHYIDGHLALNINHPYVAISKIACGAFVLGAEGRIKIFPAAEGTATEMLVEGLVEQVRRKKLAG